MMSPDFAPSASSPAARRPRTRHVAVVACTAVAVVGTLLAQTPGGAHERGTPRPPRRQGLEPMGGLRRRPRLLEVRRPQPDHAGERRRPEGGVDLSGRRQQRLPVQSHRRRHHDVRAGEEPVARRARRDDGQGAVDPRRAARHRPARHQLLGEPGRQGPPPALPDQQQPPGHRRRHRQVDPDVRHERPRRSASRASAAIPRSSAACSRARPARSSRTCCCSARRRAKATSRRPGTLRAYDVVTGKLVWAFHTVPHPGEDGYETWPKDAWKYVGGANTWGEISVDARRGIAYFPTGSPTYDYYGADRIGSNLYANSPDRARRAHRQAPVALPGRAPRSVGLRPHRGAAAGHRDARGQDASTPSRWRPSTASCSSSIASPASRCGRSRSARSPKSDDAGRADLADAAVPDQAGAVRAPADDRRRSDAVLPHRRRAGDVGRAAEEGEERPVRAALDRARDDRRARRGRRRQLGQHRRVPGQGAGLRDQPGLPVVLQAVGDARRT